MAFHIVPLGKYFSLKSVHFSETVSFGFYMKCLMKKVKNNSNDQKKKTKTSYLLIRYLLKIVIVIHCGCYILYSFA